MLTEVKTAADLAALPFYLREALRSPVARTHRYLNNIEKATRKTCLQNAVVRAIDEGLISYGLGEEILRINRALGPKGKAALALAKK